VHYRLVVFESAMLLVGVLTHATYRLQYAGPGPKQGSSSSDRSRVDQRHSSSQRYWVVSEAHCSPLAPSSYSSVRRHGAKTWNAQLFRGSTTSLNSINTNLGDFGDCSLRSLHTRSTATTPSYQSSPCLLSRDPGGTAKLG
jgi:hypothetical protein